MWKTIFQSNEWPKNTREFTKTYYRGSMPGESRKRPNSSSWRRPAELGPIVDHPKVILIEQWPALPLPCKSAACQDSFRASQSRIVFANSYRAWQPSHLRNTRALLSWSSCLRVRDKRPSGAARCCRPYALSLGMPSNHLEEGRLLERAIRLIIRIPESFSSKLCYRRISISLTTCLTLGTSAATFCASCRCLAVLTVPLTVSTPFLALNLMCCLSKEVEINAAL